MQTTLLLLLTVTALAAPVDSPDHQTPAATKNMVLIQGGTYQMGDVLGDTVRYATPVHEVTLSDFYLNRYEVTVAQFAAFVAETDYVTHAERGTGESDHGRSGYAARLAGHGAWVLDSSPGGGWNDQANWRNPQFVQDRQHPVVGVSWLDAAAYCNWLSKKEGLPIAYDLETGSLLDNEGNPTTNVTTVRGYRLPTEAEWEFAARERGKEVRFGNGRDVARSSEMNINASTEVGAHAEVGAFRKKTTPVGSFEPNALGLYDMSGNVWEWCSDFMDTYTAGSKTNPYQSKGDHGRRRAARGGPWVGDANWARAATRIGWVAEDRCNNIGFRVARSK